MVMKNVTTRLTIFIFGILCVVFLICLKASYNIIPRSYVNTDDFSLKKGDSVIIDNIKIRNSEIVEYLDGDEHVIKMNGREYSCRLK